MKISMTITANVEVTDEIREGLKEQYNWSDNAVNNDEAVAKAIMYASLNPLLSNWEVHNGLYDDWFDGVGNMKGLITNVELTDDAF